MQNCLHPHPHKVLPLQTEHSSVFDFVLLLVSSQYRSNSRNWQQTSPVEVSSSLTSTYSVKGVAEGTNRKDLSFAKATPCESVLHPLLSKIKDGACLPTSKAL